MAIFPMGAKPAKDKFKQLMEDDNYIAQEKFDGVRALVTIYNKNKVSITTRGASVDAPEIPIDITHRIPMVAEWEIPEQLVGSCLDCEILIPGLDSAQIAGIVNYKSTVPIPAGMCFKVFDCLAVDGKYILNYPFIDRDRILFSLGPVLPGWIHPIPTAHSTEQKYDMLHGLWKEGKEGIVLKNLDSLYYPDKKKANTWYKVKKVDSVDAKIIGSEAPTKYYEDPDTRQIDLTRLTKPYERGWFGALVYELEDGTVGTVSGFSDDEREMMSGAAHMVKPEYIGRVMELKFMEKTKDGKLRHPRFIRLREEIEKSM